MTKQRVLLVTPFSFKTDLSLRVRISISFSIYLLYIIFWIRLCPYEAISRPKKIVIIKLKVIFIFSFLLPWLGAMADSSNSKESGHDKAHMVQYGLCTNQSLVQYRPFYIKRSCKPYFTTLYSLLILLLCWILSECVQGTISSSTW